MDPQNPQTIELAVAADGVAGPGLGVVASFVPASGGEPPVVALACDPRHDPGRTIHELAPFVIDWIRAELDAAVADAVWVTIDNFGRFNRAVPDFSKVSPGATAPEVVYERFASGIDTNAQRLIDAKLGSKRTPHRIELLGQ